MNSKKSNLVKATIHGAFWAYGSKYTGKLLTFISTIILARLLIQEDFGVAGYALLVIGFLEGVPGLGIGPALIYYDKDSKRTNTAFWLALGNGIVLLGLTWLFAPLIGIFFNDIRSVPVTRVLAFSFPLLGLGTVHGALLRKNLSFKLRSIPHFVKGICKGLVAISLAWLGFGAWSLVLAQLAGIAAGTITLWIVSPWRPSFNFVPSLVRPLLSYGSNIIAIQILGTLLLNIDYFLIGRFLGAAALGIYFLAFRVPELLVKQFANILGQVLFPVYAKMRDNPKALGRGFLLAMHYITMLTIPVGLGLALVAKPFVLTIFTEKWIEAIPVMSAISIYTLVRSLYFNIGGVYKAQGRPDLITKLHILQGIIFIPILWWVTVSYGDLVIIAWMQVISAITFGVVRLVIASRMLNIPLNTIMETLRPAVISGVLMTLAVSGTLQILVAASPAAQLIVSVVIGALVYGGVFWWLQRDMVISSFHTLRTVLAKR